MADSISNFSINPLADNKEPEKKAPLDTTAPSSEGVTTGAPARPEQKAEPVSAKPSDFQEAPKPPPLVVEPVRISGSGPSPTPVSMATPPVVTPPASPGIIIPQGENKPAAKTADDIIAGIMANISDEIGEKSTLKMTIYGDPGSMKSSFAATAPNNLIIDLDDGLISAKFSPHGVADNVKPYPWKGFDDFEMLIKALASDRPELAWIETVTIDTFSEVHKRGLDEVNEREWRKRPTSVNRYVPETDYHQENNNRMLSIVRALKDMKKNLILITHATTVEPKGKPAKTYPDFSEKLANKIEAMMDIVGYAEKRVHEGELSMVLKTAEDNATHSKSRIPIPPYMLNPTWGQIMGVLEESKNK